MKYFLTTVIATCGILTACQTTATSEHMEAHTPHNEPTPYDPSADAHIDVENALAAAKTSGNHALIVMGANWCHDSRGLAAQFEKGRLQTLIKDHYELVYVDVGQRDRNIDIAQEFGVPSIVGTPTVFVVSPSGEVLNLDTAPTWRNAVSRSETDIFHYFRDFVNHGPKG